MAPASGNGISGVLPSCWDAYAKALLIMPTCGPLPWLTTTFVPSPTMSTMCLAVFFTSASCSWGVLPRALPPSAMTTDLPSPFW